MGIVEVTLIAIGLCADSFAVSVANGITKKNIVFWQAVKIAIFLAVFQAIMPLIGWFIGSKIELYVKDFDHWIAFILLAGIGGKMIWESLKKEDDKQNIDILKISYIITISIATSIDALIVGITLGLTKINIFFTIFIIGIITFLASMIGALIGKKTGSLIGKPIEIIGGIVLISIGLKILFEHIKF